MWLQDRCLSWGPRGCLGDQVPAATHPPEQASAVPHITSPLKGPNSKFKVRFLLNACCFCTIVKSNHPMAGTVECKMLQNSRALSLGA